MSSERVSCNGGIELKKDLVFVLGGEMEFSDTYKHSGHCVFSPDARFLAVTVDYRLVIRDVVSLKVRDAS